MNTQKRKKIAVWQPYFLGGGAEAVALWIVESLSEIYDVTLFTLSEVDLNWLDLMYNTHLASKRVVVHSVLGKGLGKTAYQLIPSHPLFRMGFIYLTIKELKSAASQYDLVFSAFNGLDMGRSGIQYLHWVHVVEKFPEKAPFWYQGLMRWVDFSHERLRQNFSIANSQHTATQVKKAYGIESEVIFPPVVTRIDALSWDQKEDTFLCSGRLVKAKEPHRVIKILKAVRERGFNIRLCITGGGGGTYELRYQRQLQKLVYQNSDWVTLHRDLSYNEYLKVAARCRYGLHFKTEPFGISVAEMLKAGIIPFVRSWGGQVEIVGPENTDLLFKEDEEAIEKISRVLENKSLQQQMSDTLKKRQELFTTERFIEQIQAVTSNYIEKNEVEIL